MKKMKRIMQISYSKNMRKIISLFLTFVMLFSMVSDFAPIVYAINNSKTAVVMHNGKQINEITIKNTDKEMLTASIEGESAAEYQWQILLNQQNNFWVNIFDKQENRCEISYALVKNMLNEKDTAFVRCKITSSNGELYTNVVAVKISEEQSTKVPESEEKVLVSDIQVITPEPETLPEQEVEPIRNFAEEVKPEPEQPINNEETGEPTFSEDNEIEENAEEVLDEDVSEDIENEEKPAETPSEETVDPTIIPDENPVDEPEEVSDISVESPESVQTFSLMRNTSESTAIPTTVDDSPMSDPYAVEPVADVTEYVTITINYLDYDSYAQGGTPGIVYDPYIATIEKGSKFIQTVISPTFIGFEPFYAKDSDGIVDDPASSIVFNYEKLNENIVINVYYKASMVKFAVKFYFQNINDDLYTEDASLYRTDEALTGSVIENDYFEKIVTSAGKDVGFQKLYHIPESIAADGSTVFECYYDRNYYLLQFDLDGGYGVEPIYARYDSPFVVNSPIKHGYHFDGWDLQTDSDKDGIDDTYDGIANPLPSTIPAANQHYKALWSTIDTEYTIVYWRENANNNEYSFWGSEKKTAKSATTVSGSDSIPASITTTKIDGKDVNEKPYFTFNSLMTDKDVLVKGDGTSVVNVYYTRNFYTITFKGSETCGIPVGHVHSVEAGCYDTICGFGEHKHTDECENELNCTIPVHTQHTDSCLICTKEVHTQHDANCCTIVPRPHEVSCYPNVGDSVTKPSGAPNSPSQGQIYRRRSGLSYYYYIYIGTQWYRYTSTASNNTIISPNCNIIAHTHTHGDGNCTCANTHVHSDENGCYIDIVHTHNVDCYTWFCDSENTHEHQQVCYRLLCTITENHTHTNSCNSSTSRTIKTVKRKYQQSLEDIWPVTSDTGTVYDDGQRWSPSNSSYYSAVLVFIATMPPDDFTLTVNTSSNSKKTMIYYTEVLPGSPYEVEYNGRYFEEYKTVEAKYGYITEAEDFFDIAGFDKLGSDPAFSGGQINTSTAKFYYTRSEHDIKFNNKGEITEVSDIKYETPLKDYYFTPGYPDNLEPYAYYFDGWYTTEECYPGTEVNWDKNTMPYEDLLLYAKWSSEVHTVNFFVTYDDMKKYEADNTSVVPYESRSDILHGNSYGSIETPEYPDASNNTIFNFAGWFYLDNGVKKAFTPLKHPINKDMNVFADWGSKVSEPYYIEYVLLSDPTVKVADSSTGYGYSGSTKTFTAKAGSPFNQLYSQYNDGYFPVVSSHSIVMQHEDVLIENASDWANIKHNTFQFKYAEAKNIEYKVRYINKETNLVMEEETFTTNSAVVTERFKAFPGMVPDAFYKRLVIAIEEDENGNWVGSESNVINFYYMPNVTSAYYAVHFMTEKLDKDKPASCDDIYALDGSGYYEESRTHMEGIGDIGSYAEIHPQDFSGFTLLEDKSIEIDWNEPVEGKEDTYKSSSSPYTDEIFKISIDAQGTELYIFYDRNFYDYTVSYIDYNTKLPVKSLETNEYIDSFVGSGQFGSTVEISAINIPGYTLITDPATRLLEITNNNSANTYPFYYVPIQYIIEYISITPDGTTGGSLTSTKQVLDSNTAIEGSTPIPSSNYIFDGWYLDEACTQPVDPDLVDATTNKLTPVMADLSDKGTNKFYAKFNYNASNLTINTTVSDGLFKWHDAEQTFIFTITSAKDSITVAIKGNGTAVISNLSVGEEYTITENSNWSWAHTSGNSKTITLDINPANNVVNFNLTLDKNNWLDVGAYCKNLFGAFGSSDKVTRID